MCLYTKQFTFKVADEDIVCWKVLEIIYGYDGEKTITPFAFRPVPEEVLNGEALFTPYESETECLVNRLKRFEEEDYDHEDYDRSVNVKEGVIHTYGAKDLKAADMYGEMTFHVNNIGGGEGYIDMHQGDIIGCDPEPDIVGIALYKCVIPKGTEYIAGSYSGYGYSGHSGSELVSYGSKAIRFVEKVAEWRRNDGYDTSNTCLWDKVNALRKGVTHEE